VALFPEKKRSANAVREWIIMVFSCPSIGCFLMFPPL
jgi:hypothetical protein